MSRGIGLLQRHVLTTLHEGPVNEGIPIGELKRQMREQSNGDDRSNLRRAVRTLIRRRLVEETTVEGEQGIRLTYRGLTVINPPPVSEDPRAYIKYLNAQVAEFSSMLQLEKERARKEAELKALRGPVWHQYTPQRIRRRRHGPTQQIILAILWQFADPPDEGLPTPAVKAIVRDNISADRSNIRRAIRSLLYMHGKIEVAEDGQRIRLSEIETRWFSVFPPISPEPIDVKRARTILEAHRGS